MKYIKFNDYYTLKPDSGQALILASLVGRNLLHGGEDSFTRTIHPIYAMLLSFIDGREATECIKRASEALDISPDLVDNFINCLLDNSNRVILKTKYGESDFPPYCIISIPEKCITKRYSPEIFGFTFTDIRVRRHLTPSTITLMINNICVTDCIYCYEDKSKKVSCSIPLDRILTLIHEAKKLYVSTFDVIGGEFFLYKHWKTVLKELRICGYHPYLSTKIPLSEDDVKFLSELNIHDIQISIDSLIEEHLIPSLGVKKGYVDNMLNSLALMEKYGIPVMVHTVLTKYNANAEDMESIYTVIKDMKCLMDWHIVKGDAPLYPRVPYESFEISPESLNDVVEHLENIKEESGLSIRYPQKTIVSTDEVDTNEVVTPKDQEESFFTRSFCSGLFSSLYILPDGQVTICEQLYWNKDFIVGNVMDNSLEEIWNSEKSKSLYYIKQEDIPSDSLCHTCDKFEVCRTNRQVCYREIIRKYGRDKWYYPDVNCPYNTK